MKTTTYKLGDLSNGYFAEYQTEDEALKALKESIDDGTFENIQAIGEEGCPWKNGDEAREAAEAFFYVSKYTREIDDDGDVSWDNYEVIAGRIQ